MILFFYLMTCISNHCSMRTPLQQLFRMIACDGCHFKCELINVCLKVFMKPIINFNLHRRDFCDAFVITGSSLPLLWGIRGGKEQPCRVTRWGCLLLPGSLRTSWIWLKRSGLNNFENPRQTTGGKSVNRTPLLQGISRFLYPICPSSYKGKKTERKIEFYARIYNIMQLKTSEL